ncbi:MAG: glycerol kinase [Alphaproteobacteria bacterium]|nr:glycerol kinase [Alphaproteobacteria bacterium]|tara:strand:- start:785 stop:2257 length:1473 start_codon:yes stop_codon:yes gene_type:complete
MSFEILSLDQGTTSSRAILFDSDATIKEISQQELKLFYPHKGWVEQDANAIIEDTLQCAKDVASKASNIRAIGITNQRETTIVWNKDTGEPVYNAIVWQDRRTAKICEALKAKGYEQVITQKTGLVIDPYFSATKIAWILDNVEDVREKAEKGELLFGTVDCFLLWHLTEGREHATDITNASRTLLYNIHDCKWDEELLKIFDIPKNMLPEVKPNTAHFGETDKIFQGQNLPITGMAGDQQSALVGQACFDKGMVKSTYGTGCFALINTGTNIPSSHNGLVTTIAYDLGQGPKYAVEGSIFVAGAAIQWLRDNLNVFCEASESETLALSVEDSNEVIFVPAFTGLGAPYWDPGAKAAILNLSRETNKAHITRAALEAQAFQTYDLIHAMQQDTGLEIKTIRADGGLVANKFMCQTLANFVQAQIDVPEISESTALGAAYLAGLGAGLYKDEKDISDRWKLSRSYKPEIQREDAKKGLTRWHEAVGRVRTS